MKCCSCMTMRQSILLQAKTLGSTHGTFAKGQCSSRCVALRPCLHHCFPIPHTLVACCGLLPSPLRLKKHGSASFAAAIRHLLTKSSEPVHGSVSAQSSFWARLISMKAPNRSPGAQAGWGQVVACRDPKTSRCALPLSLCLRLSSEAPAWWLFRHGA